MAFQLESHVATGTRIPYHVSSRVRLPIITGDALRAAFHLAISDNSAYPQFVATSV